MKCVRICHSRLYTARLIYCPIGTQHEVEGSGRKFTAPYTLHNHTKLNNDTFSKGDCKAQQRVGSIIHNHVSCSVNSLESSAGHDSISDSSFSSSPLSIDVLPPPGRRGPLSSSARADAQAVKHVKACWRCKILRKKARVSLRSPRMK
jgi:hypothetical protein